MGWITFHQKASGWVSFQIQPKWTSIKPINCMWNTGLTSEWPSSLIHKIVKGRSILMMQIFPKESQWMLWNVSWNLLNQVCVPWQVELARPEPQQMGWAKLFVTFSLKSCLVGRSERGFDICEIFCICACLVLPFVGGQQHLTESTSDNTSLWLCLDHWHLQEYLRVSSSWPSIKPSLS